MLNQVLKDTSASADYKRYKDSADYTYRWIAGVGKESFATHRNFSVAWGVPTCYEGEIEYSFELPSEGVQQVLLSLPDQPPGTFPIWATQVGTRNSNKQHRLVCGLCGCDADMLRRKHTSACLLAEDRGPPIFNGICGDSLLEATSGRRPSTN